MVSFYISRAAQAAIDKLAADTGNTKADTYRALLGTGLLHTDKDSDNLRVTRDQQRD